MIISRDIKENDALMIVMSRRNYPSYLKNMAMIPTYLNKYFCKNSCILVYPMQIGIGEQELGALKSIPHADSHDRLDDLADVLRGLFKRNNDLIRLPYEKSNHSSWYYFVGICF